MPQVQPPIPGDKRTRGERRDNSDRRQRAMDWSGAERRRAGERRSWVGRRQAAAWRRPS